MSELKKCPFCGGETTIYIGKAGYGAMCKDTPFCAVLPAVFANKESAIKAWNTRKPMQNIVERLEKKICSLHNINWNTAVEEAIEIVREEGGMNDNT